MEGKKVIDVNTGDEMDVLNGWDVPHTPLSPPPFTTPYWTDFALPNCIEGGVSE